MKLVTTIFCKIFKSGNSVTKIEKKISYTFINKKYLEQAFTHKSINNSPKNNYERLEFLGDSVLDIIISRELMREFPDGDEGLLTKKRLSSMEKIVKNTNKNLNTFSYF